MKKKHRINIAFAALAIAAVLTFTGCGDIVGGDTITPSGSNTLNEELPVTNGKFTLTGASAYNGLYAHAQGTIETGSIYGTTGTIFEMRGIQIQGGTVELPMYYTSWFQVATTAYSGSDTITARTVEGLGKLYSFQVYIMPTADPNDYVDKIGSHYIVWDTVTFSSGCVTKDVSEGTYY